MGSSAWGRKKLVEVRVETECLNVFEGVAIIRVELGGFGELIMLMHSKHSDGARNEEILKRGGSECMRVRLG